MTLRERAHEMLGRAQDYPEASGFAEGYMLTIDVFVEHLLAVQNDTWEKAAQIALGIDERFKQKTGSGAGTVRRHAADEIAAKLREQVKK